MNLRRSANALMTMWFKIRAFFNSLRSGTAAKAPMADGDDSKGEDPGVWGESPPRKIRPDAPFLVDLVRGPALLIVISLVTAVAAHFAFFRTASYDGYFDARSIKQEVDDQKSWRNFDACERRLQSTLALRAPTKPNMDNCPKPKTRIRW